MHFFNDTISIYTIAFASLFNNIKVQRIDKNQSPAIIKEIDVPLIYSNKAHWFYKQKRNIADQENISRVLPTMSFNLDSMITNPERQTNKFETIKFEGDLSRAVRDWVQTAVPHTFSFNLSILTKFQSELNQILEQILPFFPALTRDLHVKEVPMLGVYRSVRLTLAGLSDAIELDYQDNGNRVLSYELQFDLDGYLYPPIKEQEIITHVDMNVYMQMLGIEYENDAPTAEPDLRIIVNPDGTEIQE